MASRWFSPRALRLHAALVVVVPACVALCIWQVHRALSGNELSWAYVFEWPFFAGYGVYMWWRLLREQLSGAPGPPVSADAAVPAGAGEPEPAGSKEPDDELAAYNRYLAQLHASGRQKRW